MGITIIIALQLEFRSLLLYLRRCDARKLSKRRGWVTLLGRGFQGVNSIGLILCPKTCPEVSNGKVYPKFARVVAIKLIRYFFVLLNWPPGLRLYSCVFIIRVTPQYVPFPFIDYQNNMRHKHWFFDRPAELIPILWRRFAQRGAVRTLRAFFPPERARNLDARTGRNSFRVRVLCCSCAPVAQSAGKIRSIGGLVIWGNAMQIEVVSF